jgi:hypothetical protein
VGTEGGEALFYPLSMKCAKVFIVPPNSKSDGGRSFKGNNKGEQRCESNN